MKKIIFILTLLICFFAGYSQQIGVPYLPSKHVVVNDAIGPAQATPLDGRAMYYDTTLFLWRAFRDTAEVRTVLNASKYRFGAIIIVVDSGGTLQSNGTFLNPHNTFWMFRDSTTNSALLKMWLFNDNPISYTASAPIYIIGNNISIDTGIVATKYWVGSQGFLTNINGLIQAGTNITITGSGSSISPYVINSGAGSGTLSSVGLTMPSAFTVNNSPLVANGTINVTANGTASQYIQGNGVLNTFPALFNPIAGLGIKLTGTYPNITFAVDTTQRLDTVFGKYPLYVPFGTPDTLAIYHATPHSQGYADSVDVVYWDAKQQPIQFPYGSLGGVDSILFGTNITGSIAGGTLTINANNSSTNNLTWLNQSNSVVATIGAGLFIRGGTGLSTIKTGTDTVTFSVIPDTTFARNLLTAAGTDTMDFGGPGAKAFFNTYANMRGLYSMTWDSLSAGFYLKLLGNKSSLLSTDSVLGRDNTGKVFVISASAIGGGGSLVGADNGLSIAASDTVQLGGNLDFSTAINGGANYTLTSTSSISGTTATFNGLNTGSGIGISGQSISGTGITAQSGSGNGLVTVSTSGEGIIASSGSNLAATFNINPSSTNTIASIEQLQRETTGAATAGIGVSQDFYVEDNSALTSLSNQLVSKLTNVTHGSVTSQFSIWGVNAGTNAQLFSVNGNGLIQGNTYGSGTHTGTPVYNILEDASGNLIEGAVPVGGLVGADQGTQIVAGDTVQLGGSFYKNDTIEAKTHNFLMDTVGFYEVRSVNLTSGLSSSFISNSSLALMETAASAGTNDSIAEVETIHSGGNYKALLVAGAGALGFYGQIYAQTMDSSINVYGAHIRVFSDTTKAGDGITISELPYITDSTNERNIVWNVATGKLSAMTTGGSGGGGSSFSVATASGTSNYTISGANNYIILSDLTGQANRNVVLPSAPTSGQQLFIKNINTNGSTFNWTFTNGTVKDASQNTITIATNLSVYYFVFDGTNWDISN